MIGSLGIFVLNEACRQVAIWQRDFPERAGLSISVNLSPRQFQDTALVTDVARALETSGLPPESLILEITESVIMSDVEATIGKLWQLRGMGINLAIDDFGTGYSSLAYLKRLPIHILKIDRSFIQGIAENPEDAAIVQAIMTLARSLDLKVTAEGIETPDQAALLEGWAADRAQGYYFARPANASAIELMLASRAPFKELNQAA